MREEILFDDDWLFHRGDVKYSEPVNKGAMYQQAKTERARTGPACRQYIPDTNGFQKDHKLYTETWEEVCIPHDYVILQKPNSSYNSGLGYFKYENAWYRKNFKLSEYDRNKRITLLFDGIATHATVYLNGCLIGRNFCGYTSFEVDITDFVDFENENVLAVYVETDEHEGWWYEGGGIYRHVHLVKTSLVSVDLWGLYVAPKMISKNEWNVNTSVCVRNDDYIKSEIDVVVEITDGASVVMKMSESVRIPLRTKKEVHLSGKLKNPILWDLNNPYRYTAIAKIYQDGILKDEYKTKFGFRYFYFDEKKRFILNGKHIQINGVCAHQDFGFLGKAVSDNLNRYKIEQIKKMGANGYRCTHYPHSESIMEALDDLGFVVMAETRWFDSSPEGLKQLQMLIKRDRNRPSVFMWSVLNEEPMQTTENGKRICKNMIAEIKKLDDTRLITGAVDTPVGSSVYDELDVIGINYNLDKYDDIHKQFPDKPIFASECCAVGTTRDWYYDTDLKKGYWNSFDCDTNNWFLSREKTYSFFSKREWIFGSFQWISVEHRGECIWPSLCSKSGAFDMFMQRKDAYYQNQSFWIDDKPVIHLAPHWNFRGREGEPMRVIVYTNCDLVRLVLNGKIVGEKSVGKCDHAEWQVVYEPGVLEAVGYLNGNECVRDKKVTSQNAVRLVLCPENDLSALRNGDIALFTCYCVDVDGNIVCDASPYVRFMSNSYGCIVGTGSDVCDSDFAQNSERRMFMGKISVGVKVSDTMGILRIYAESQNLISASYAVELKQNIDNRICN